MVEVQILNGIAATVTVNKVSKTPKARGHALWCAFSDFFNKYYIEIGAVTEVR